MDGRKKQKNKRKNPEEKIIGPHNTDFGHMAKSEELP